ELNRLCERYRAPLVLCYLEGKTQDEAAAQLALAKGTLKGRLERARELLRARLRRRGLGPAAVALVAAWPAGPAAAGVPAAWLGSTVKAATAVRAGRAAAGVISSKVATLTEGVLRAMFLTRLKLRAAGWFAGLLAVSVVGAVS